MDTYARRSPWSFRLLLGVLLFFGGATAELPQASASERDWLPPETASLHDELRSQRDSVLGVAAAMKLDDAMRWMRADQALAELQRAQAVARDPQLRAWLTYMEQRLMVELGRDEDALRLERALGFVDHWILAGPFRNDGMAGFETRYEPELQGYQGEDQRLSGRFDGLQWLPTTRNEESGYLEVASYIPEAATAVVYAMAECYFERGEVEAQLAVDGAYRLWVNEQPVAQAAMNRGGVFLRDSARVSARRGWNRIALKLATDRVSGGWHLRFVDARGQSVVRECRNLSAPSGPLAEADVFPEATSIAASLRAQAEAGSWSDNQRVDAAYIVRVLHNQDASEPWKFFLNGVDRAQLSPVHLLRAAEVETQEWRGMDYAREAQQRPDVDVTSAIRALALRSGEAGFHARLDYIRGITELARSAPEDLRVRLAALRNIGDTLINNVIAEEIAALVDTYGARPALCEQALEVVANRYDVRRHVSEVCAARGLASLDAVLARMMYLASLGELDAAKALMASRAQGLAHRPGWERLQRALAGVEADWGAVLASVDRELALRPNDAELTALRADVLLRLGRDEEAAAALRQALVLRPQLRAARQLLDAIEAQEDGFYTPWRVDAEELRLRAASLDLRDHDLGRIVDQRVVNVFSSGLTASYAQQAYRVETRAGADEARYFPIHYSPGEEVVELIAARILRPDGSVREAVETRDVAPYSGPSMMYDSYRRRVITLTGVEAGDIVSIEYTVSEVASQNSFDDYFGSLWLFDSTLPTSLARYVLITPEDFEVFEEIGAGSDPKASTVKIEESNENGQRLRVYSDEQLSAIEREPYAVGWSETHRYLHLSNYDDLNELADWYWNFVREQLVASPEMKATVHALIDGEESRREQIARIYGYVVQNTRYVHIPFGLHGFKPYRATECFERKFGDCKDTAALLKVMLGIADIHADLVLIRTRDLGKMSGAVPSLSLFNHMIAYVPEFDLYLDGTATTNGSQELPNMDQGAFAYHILDGGGGRFVDTPFLSAEMNATEWRTRVDARDETPSASLRMSYIGGSAASLRRSLEAPDQRREYMERLLSRLIPAVEVTRAEFSDLRALEEPVRIDIETEGGRWFTRRGDDAVLLPFGRTAFDLQYFARPSRRTLPLDLGAPAVEQQHFEIQLPANFEAANVASRRVEIAEPEIGHFVLDLEWDADARVLRVHGTLRRDAAIIAPEDYARFRSWTHRVEREANTPLIFRVGE